MLDQLLVRAMRGLLWLRYRITVRGLDRIAPRDGRGMLILPNHPALIDPVILMTVLWPRFRPHVLADRAQVDRPGVRFLMRRVRAPEMADMTKDGRGASDEVEAVVQACGAALCAGDALLLYPAGRQVSASSWCTRSFHSRRRRRGRRGSQAWAPECTATATPKRWRATSKGTGFTTPPSTSTRLPRRCGASVPGSEMLARTASVVGPWSITTSSPVSRSVATAT
jgi:hypothetical protein